MGIGITAEDPSKHGHRPAQILKIEGTPHRPVRLAEIQDQQPSPRTEHPVQLRQARLKVGQIAQAIADRHHRKRSIWKRQSQGIPLEKPNLGCARLRAAPPGNRQHGFAEIDPRDVGARPGQRQRDIARAATDIQRRFAGLNCGQLDQPTLPPPMQTEALQIVDDVVAGCDRGKQVINPFRSRLAFDIILTRHSRRVTTDGQLTNPDSPRTGPG